MNNLKNCTKCNIIKENDAFYNDTRLKTGLSSRCKQCQKETSASYNKTPEGKRKLNEYQKKRYQEGKTKSYYIPVTCPKKTGRKPKTKNNLCKKITIKKLEKLKEEENKLLDELILINDRELTDEELEARTKEEHIFLYNYFKEIGLNITTYEQEKDFLDNYFK